MNQIEELDKRLWRYEDLAAYLQVAPQTVRKWVSQGKIPPSCVVRLGRLVRFKPEYLGNFFDWSV